MATAMSTEQPIPPMPAFAGILKDRDTYSTSAGQDFSNRINSGFDLLMIQSGLEMAPSLLLLLCVFSAMTIGGAVFVFHENLLTTALGAVIGAIVPIVTAFIIRMRRQKQIMDQLSPMIDELARAAKTGRSVHQCLQIVAEDTPDPLGSELRLCTRRMELGMDLSDALKGLPTRTGLVALNILVTALTVHQQTGGDLVRVLERLSQTIRDRLLFLGRLRAATIGSRATAILMLALPVLIVGFFIGRDPNYISELLATQWGRILTILAISLQIIGSFWVFRILQNSQRA